MRDYAILTMPCMIIRMLAYSTEYRTPIFPGTSVAVVKEDGEIICEFCDNGLKYCLYLPTARNFDSITNLLILCAQHKQKFLYSSLNIQKTVES